MAQRLPTLIELDRELAKRSLAEFCKMAWHVLEPATPICWGWALDAMCEHLEAVHNGDIKRLLMNVPPGMMKSLLTGVFFPAWEWGPCNSASLRYLTAAHKEPLAVRDNMKCRRLIQSDWYQQRWPVQLTGDQNAKTKFENVETGFRESMSFKSLTGSRGDRVIIDDPLSVDDAFSEAALEAAKQTFLEAVPSRVNNKDSAIIVIMQRLHEADTSGVILSEDLGYTHLMLPMRFEEGRRCVTSIGFRDPRKKDGELLFPERFSEAQVSELEKTMGSYAVAGQLQQRPTPRGGGMFKSEWLKFWTPETLPGRFESMVISWDMTFKETATSDFVVGQVWGREQANFYLLDQVRGRMDFVKTRQAFIDLAEKWPKVRRKLVEDKANGPAIISALKDVVTGIVPITPKESKEARAASVTTFFEAGNVYLPSPDLYPWVKTEYIPELLAFPAGAHDDQCFAAETMIATLRGDIRIEDVRVGDHVLTPFGFKRVLFAGQTGVSQTITKFGITATRSHPFINKKGDLVNFSEVNDIDSLSFLRLKDIWNIRKKLSLMGLSIGLWGQGNTISANQQQTKAESELKGYTLQFGSTSLGKKFQKVMKCITKTAIPLITISATLSVYRAVNIAKRLTSKLKKSKDTLTAFDTLHPNGIGARKVGNGIGNTPKTLREKVLNVLAFNAEKHSSQRIQMPNIVADLAKSSIDTQTKRLKLRKSAKFAENHLKLSKGLIENLPPYVAGLAGENLDGFVQEVPVFNLTVEDAHMFYANGVLVHNCDSTTQAINDLHLHTGWKVAKSNVAAIRAQRFR